MKSFQDIKPIVQSIDGWLSQTEALFLYTIAKKLQGGVVEIGSWKGKSTLCLASAITGGRGVVYAVDPHKGVVDENQKRNRTPTYQQFLQTLKKAGVKDRVVAIRKTSKDAATHWKTPIQFLFIDGLHDYFHAKEDFTLWIPFVVDGGVVAFHDAYGGIEGSEKAAKEALLTPNFTGVGVAGSILYGVKQRKTGWVSGMQNTVRAFLIKLGSYCYQMKVFPFALRFLVVHRIIKIFLIDGIHIEMEKNRV